MGLRSEREKIGFHLDRAPRRDSDHRNYIDLKKLIPYVNLWQNCIYKAFLSPVNTL